MFGHRALRSRLVDNASAFHGSGRAVPGAPDPSEHAPVYTAGGLQKELRTVRNQLTLERTARQSLREEYAELQWSTFANVGILERLRADFERAAWTPAWQVEPKQL